jgi:hypothetical protein
MSLDSMLGFVVPGVVLLALAGVGGCVVPEDVGNGPPTAGDGSGSGSGSGSDGDTDPTGTTSDPEQTDGETGSAMECFGQPDEASCLAAGCSEFHTVLEISDTCECMPGLAACLLFTGGIGGSASPDFFWHEATGTVAMFDTSWIELPVGWRRCSDAGAPAGCGCYEPFMAPECP